MRQHVPGTADAGDLRERLGTAVAETLQELLLDPSRRPQVVTDCQGLLDSEVESKSGFSSIPVKGAYGMVKAVRPGIIHDAVDDLLDQLVARLEPFYADYRSAGGAGSLPDYLAGRGDEISDALLTITDARAERSHRATIKKAYGKLRPQGKKHVQEALPGVGKIIEKYAAG
jgi:hypothetical protein